MGVDLINESHMATKKMIILIIMKAIN